MSSSKRGNSGDFIRLFNSIGFARHRYEVFRDFVTMAALALHNAIHKLEHLENEYLAIIGQYTKEDAEKFPKLLGELITLLDTEPRDVLGQLYMELDLGNTHTGQFFTPPELSELMARITYGETVEKFDQPFIMFSEPTCGAGGMILSFVKLLISKKLNPAERVWVEAQDIDRTAALMCYVQMSLWHIPGVVIVGNTLTMERREVFYTPAHHLGRWDYRLKLRAADTFLALPQAVETFSQEKSDGERSRPNEAHEESKQDVPTTGGVSQFDFGF